MVDHSKEAVRATAGEDTARRFEERRQNIQRRMRQIRHKLIIMSGKGGVGKSTVAAYLAIALASEGKKVGLMDADIHGPSIPAMLGLEGRRIAATPGGISPITYSENLRVVSIGFLLSSKEAAVIWRGPLKMGLIEEFLANVDWGPLDYLIIDSPPGTGDEPLSVCQLLPDLDGALIVATPQDIALADVEKSITFCRKVHTRVAGVIENMSGFVCPNCGERVDVFKRGGAERLARRMSVPFLGSIPIVPEVVELCDGGNCSLASITSVPFRQALEAIIDGITKQAASGAGAQVSSQKAPQPSEGAWFTQNCSKSSPDVRGITPRRIALPLDGDRLSTHFGHSPQFAIYDVEDAKIIGQRVLTPPPHVPGILPSWLKDQGVTLVITGGLGRRALAAFEQAGIEVISGAPPGEARSIVSSYLSGDLELGENICDH